MAGRFLASLVSSFFVFSGTGIGALFASIIHSAQGNKMGPVRLMTYIKPYLTGVLPNVLFVGVLFFSIAILTRKIFAVYMGSLGLFMGYIVGLSLIQSQNRLLGSLLDPFGQISVRNLYDYWSIAQKNSQLIPFEVRNVGAIKSQLPRGGDIQAPDDVHKGGFPGT